MSVVSGTGFFSILNEQDKHDEAGWGAIGLKSMVLMSLRGAIVGHWTYIRSTHGWITIGRRWDVGVRCDDRGHRVLMAQRMRSYLIDRRGVGGYWWQYAVSYHDVLRWCVYGLTMMRTSVTSVLVRGEPEKDWIHIREAHPKRCAQI